VDAGLDGAFVAALLTAFVGMAGDGEDGTVRSTDG